MRIARYLLSWRRTKAPPLMPQRNGAAFSTEERDRLETQAELLNETLQMAN